MIPPDYHMHTRFSDGNSEHLDDHVRRALECGITEMGFSDHVVPAVYDYAGYGIARERLDEYVGAVRALRARFPELTILLGAEVDFVPDTEAEIDALLAGRDFDYVIGSVHFVAGFGFDEDRNRGSDRWQAVDVLFEDYYATLARAAARGHFDVVGHFGLIKKFGHHPRSDPAAREEAALDAIAAAGLALELNTSGLFTPAGEIYPGPRVLAGARARGIPIVFGSDAHRPGDVGRAFGQALALARGAGYETTLRLSDRTEVPLP